MNGLESEINREVIPGPGESGSTERVESGEARDMEISERQMLEDAASHPEAVIEHQGNLQQAEAVEKIVVEMAATTPGAIQEFNPDLAEKAIEAMTPEQRAVLDSFSPEDQADLVRVFEQAQTILPGKLPGRSGGFIY